MSEVVGLIDGVLRVRLRAPATEGRANKELVAFLAGRLGVPKSRVLLVHGSSSRYKLVEVESMSAQEVLRRLGVSPR